jgi:hypothetical protein
MISLLIGNFFFHAARFKENAFAPGSFTCCSTPFSAHGKACFSGFWRRRFSHLSQVARRRLSSPKPTGGDSSWAHPSGGAGGGFSFRALRWVSRGEKIRKGVAPCF